MTLDLIINQSNLFHRLFSFTMVVAIIMMKNCIIKKFLVYLIFYLYSIKFVRFISFFIHSSYNFIIFIQIMKQYIISHKQLFAAIYWYLYEKIKSKRLKDRGSLHAIDNLIAGAAAGSVGPNNIMLI